MTEQQQELIDIQLDIIKNFIANEGDIFPHVTVFGKRIDSEEEAVSVIKIPFTKEVFKMGEERFIQEVLPKIGKKIKQDFDIYGVSFSSMAKMSIMKVNKDTLEEEGKTETEVVVISFEFDDVELPTLRVFEVKKTGQKVTEDGEIVDDIELTYNKEISEHASESMEGAMVGLYKKLIS